MFLKAENLQRTGSFKSAAPSTASPCSTSTAREASWPRAPATTARRSPGAPARRGGRDDLHARGDPDGQGRGDAELRRANRARRLALRRVPGGRDRARRGNRATFLHAFEDEQADRRPGHDRGRAPRPARSRRRGRDPDRRRRARVGVAALRSLRPDIRLIGVQAAECAPFAGATEHGFTIAEGIMVKEPGQLTRRLLDGLLDDIVTVPTRRSARRSCSCSSAMKLVGRGRAPRRSPRSSAAGSRAQARPWRCSGGNIDATLLISVMRTGSRSRAAT